MNTIPKVFNTENADHENFKPVYDWIFNGKGIVVYGGSTYKRELSRLSSYLGLIKILSTVNKTYEGSREDIDKKEESIKDDFPKEEFDDPHLVAILIETGCLLICSEDKRAHKYLKHRNYFKGRNRPKIYSSARHIELLNDKNIGKCCGSGNQLNKEVIDNIRP